MSVLLSIGVVILAVLNRARLYEAWNLALSAQPQWLLLALALVLASYLINSQVLFVATYRLGHRFSILRLWLTAIVAIIVSQLIPAGAIGSYAFLVGSLRQRGMPGAQAALVASLEAFSYGSAMLLVCTFSLIFLTIQTLAPGTGDIPLLGPLVAGLFALLVLGGAAFVLTRSREWLTRRVLAVHNRLARLLRRSWDEKRVHRLMDDLVKSRDLFISQPQTVVLLVLIQCLGLAGHSLALMLVLLGLGTPTGFAVVLAIFGVALISSTFNVLPGGGGTVETLLVAALSQFVAGSAATAAVIIFRLFNFWLLLPVAAAGYSWLMQRVPPESDAAQP